MSKVHSKGTKCEIRLRQSLRKAGMFGYRINYRNVTGTPDVVFLSKKIAIFCDSDFWHGRKGLPASNQAYWKEKLEKNAQRDLKVNQILTTNGWHVLRFSETEILKNSKDCVEKIKNTFDLTGKTKKIV